MRSKTARAATRSRHVLLEPAKVRFAPKADSRRSQVMELSPSAQRASDFDSEGREFESLRARQHLSLQIKGFLQFRLRSFRKFPCCVLYFLNPFNIRLSRLVASSPRNTDATPRFAVCSGCGVRTGSDRKQERRPDARRCRTTYAGP